MNKLYKVTKLVPTALRSLLAEREAGVCNISAVLNESDELEIQFGSLWVKDTGVHSGYKGFDSVYPFHFWNIDSNDNVYDDYQNLYLGLEQNKFSYKNEVENWKIRLVDGSEWNCISNGKVSLRLLEEKRKHLNKWFKDYDALYVYNFAFIPDYETSYKNSKGMPFTNYKSQMTWDDAEGYLESGEQYLNEWNNLFSK